MNVLWFAGPQDVLEGVANPSGTLASAPIHRFDDTKHRWIVYSATATSRFQEYFPQKGLDFTRTGPTLIVDVPSSARPSVPSIDYVIPVFGWENQETTNVKTSVRYGNGLRVYLNRGWYSSGNDEQLGVVLWSQATPAPDYATREKNKGLFTEWGADPIWANGVWALRRFRAFDFPNAAATASGLAITESAATRRRGPRCCVRREPTAVVLRHPDREPIYLLALRAIGACTLSGAFDSGRGAIPHRAC